MRDRHLFFSSLAHSVSRRCGDELKVGKKLCFKCGTNVSALTKKPPKEEKVPDKVVSNADVAKVWGRVVSEGMAGQPAQPVKAGAAKTRAAAPAPVAAPVPTPVAPAASAPRPAAPATQPVASAPAAAAKTEAASKAEAAASNIQMKEAMGLQKCEYCTKFCYVGEGEMRDGKMYHIAYCLDQAKALSKSANAEADAKQQQSKKASTPIDPIINEILKTEEAYIKDLDLIIVHFMQPCRQDNILSPEDVQIVFCNIEKLKKLHEVVVVGLHAEAKKPAKIQNWGLVFKTYEASFRAEYQVYTKNQSKARARRLALEQEEKFKTFIGKVFKHPEIRLTDLNSYLIKPVQRICKYPLLLRELSKAFEAMGIANEEAKNDLGIAMGGMSEVLKKANDYMSTLRGETTAAAPAAAADSAAGNVCNFCKKPVNARDRRLENGIVYHAELCFNREKAADELSKKRKDNGKGRSKKKETKVLVNPLMEQRAKLAQKKEEQKLQKSPPTTGVSAPAPVPVAVKVEPKAEPLHVAPSPVPTVATASPVSAPSLAAQEAEQEGDDDEAAKELEVATILAAVDVEAELLETAAAPEIDAKKDLADEEMTEGSFSTLRRRRGEPGPSIPRELARTLRIVEENREVFATIHRQQLADEEAKASALLKNAAASSERDVVVLAKMAAAEERTCVAETEKIAAEAEKKSEQNAAVKAEGSAVMEGLSLEQQDKLLVEDGKEAAMAVGAGAGAGGFYVESASGASFGNWPEPSPNDAVFRLAQTAVQVAHEAARELLNEVKKDNLFEAPDSTQVLLEDSGKFVAASLAKTVQLITHHVTVDIELLMTFLHVYGALMLPTDLIALLRARWHMDAPASIKDPEQREEWRKVVRKGARSRIVLVLRLWVKWHPRTFREGTPAYDQMIVFLTNDVIPKVGEQGLSIKGDLLAGNVVAVLGQKPESLSSATGSVSSLRDIHPIEMARQLALLTFDLYSRISSCELLQRRWLMAHKTLLSPSVLNLLSHEHRLKNWFATQVLSERDRKERAVILSRLIMIAVECRKLHNFSGMMAAVNALQDASIKRLSRTWSLIPSLLLAELRNVEVLIDSANEHALLVAEMSSTAVPGIPYLGCVLSRIEQMEDRLPYVLQETKERFRCLLSLSKIRLVGNLVNQIVRFQTHGFNFDRVDSIAELVNSKCLDDIALLRVSLTLEAEGDAA